MEYRTYGRWQPSIRDVVFVNPHRRYYSEPSSSSSSSNNNRKNFSLGVLKSALGVCALLLGLLALVFEITLSGVGAGVWAGPIVLVSGVTAIMWSRVPKSFSMTVGVLVSCSVSAAASGLLVIFSATALTRDLTEDSNKSPAVNSALVAAGIVDAVLSMTCIAMAGGDACSCNKRRRAGPFVLAPPPRGGGPWHHEVPVYGEEPVAGQAGPVGKDRLLSWVDQQRVHFWMARGNGNRMSRVEESSGHQCPGCSSASTARELSSECPTCRSRDTSRTTLASTLVDGTSMARAQDFVVRSLSVPCYP